MKNKKLQKERLLITRYQKVIEAGTANLQQALAEHLKLVPPDKQAKAVSIKEDPLQFTLKEGGHAYHDVTSLIYCLYDRPFLRYRFRLRGNVFDFVIEEIDHDDKGTKEGHNRRESDSGGHIVGLDGRPLDQRS